MKVSFLITYYNQAKFVKQSLESCLFQTYKGELEILVADDGSTDETCSIVQAYIDKYPNIIKLFQMPREHGKVYNSIERVSAARLFLLEKATGDYFCTLDGDDWYCNNTYLQKGIDILEKDKTIAACAFLYQMWYDENHIEKSSWYKKSKRVPAWEYIRGKYIHAGACIHRRDISGDDFALVKNEGIFDDNDILIYTLNKGDLYFIPEIIYSYRQTEGSSWNSSSFLLRNLINVWTYELENKFSNYKKDILFRYSNEIYYLFKHKSEIIQLYSDKNALYFNYTNNNDTVFLNSILNYESISFGDRKLFDKKFSQVSINVHLNNCLLYKFVRKSKRLLNKR